MLHPDSFRMASDTHREDLLREAARDRLADCLPRSHSSPRVTASRLLRKLADALDLGAGGAVLLPTPIAQAPSEASTTRGARSLPSV